MILELFQVDFEHHAQTKQAKNITLQIIDSMGYFWYKEHSADRRK